MNKKQRRWRNRIIAAIALFVIVYAICESGLLDAFGYPAALYIEFALFLVPYLIGGYDVLLRAGRNIAHGQVFDENFLMVVATIGAFALVLFPDSKPHMAEGAAVMLFYQVGELFQSYAVGKSRKSISDMMDIAPEYANVMRDGEVVEVDPYEVAPGDEIIVKPGERIPLDGVVVTGASQLDTAALTGESMQRNVEPGQDVISGCLNLTSVLTVRVTKPYEDSTVSRILELVENAADKKAKTENFITRFARIYTPAVVILAALIAIIPPLLFGQHWADWVERGLTFLVVSCPCALVISVPLSFFGGIGGASRVGVLVKGSNYLEVLSHVDTVVFDKTGTLTTGTFAVADISPASHLTEDELLTLTAKAESFSNHPIAASVRSAYEQRFGHAATLNGGQDSAQEVGGHGVKATVDGSTVLVGNDKLMASENIDVAEVSAVGTILHVAVDGRYAGFIVIADVVKPDSKQAIAALKKEGVSTTVMLTGDRTEVARAVAADLGITEVRAELLPQDKVAEVETLLAAEPDGHKLAFVGDGINDAPVLTRADVGIAMGALGSDVAIEAADVVLMDDNPKLIARAIALAKKTMGIVWQNIIFAIGIKLLVLVLAALGLANMWMAVFADVGVAIIAILNAMRAMKVKRS